MADQNPIQDKLKPRGLKRYNFETKVNLEFERFSGFISEYSGNISEGGMFIKSLTPQPVGSVFSFEFRLRDAIKLIQGWGEVVWVREAKDADASHEAGMGIKFIDLDEESRNLIRRIVNTEKGVMGEKNKSGGSIQDILNDAALFDDTGFESTATAETERIEAPSLQDSVLLEPSTNEAPPSMSDTDPLSFVNQSELGESEIVEMIDAPSERKIPWGILITVVVLLALGGAGYFFRDLIIGQYRHFMVKTPPPSPVPTVTTPLNVPAESTPTAPVVEAIPAKVIPTTPSVPAATVAKPKLPAATSIKAIKLVQSTPQQTVFEISLNGAINDPLTIAPVDQPPPRLVLDLPGIAKKYSTTSITVKDPRVSRLRLGLHEKPDMMRLVFDLKKDFSGKSEVISDGDKVRVTLSQP